MFSLKRAVHYLEYKGNIFFPNWVHVPVWNTLCAEETYEAAAGAFHRMHRQHPGSHLSVAEFCSASTKNTLHVITKLVKELRNDSDREVLISSTLLPIAN